MGNALYATLWDRLVANTAEPSNAQACWVWSTGKVDRYGYARLNIRVGGKHVAVSAHVAAWVILAAQPETVQDFYLAYLEFRASGLHLDHICVNSSCIYPDHLEPVTPKENMQRRDRRRRDWIAH